VLSSIRVIRDYQALGTAPAEVLTPPRTTADTIRWCLGIEQVRPRARSQRRLAGQGRHGKAYPPALARQDRSSIRVIRDYQALGTAPAEVLTPPRTTADTIRWSR
jgi:hypothetical protein